MGIQELPGKDRIRTALAIRAIVALLLFASSAVAQIDEAKRALANRDFGRAVEILVQSTAANRSADEFLYLGIAYGNLKEYPRAEDTLREGSNRFATDPRFHNELAGVYLATREIEKAKSELRKALEIDPQNNYASDLIASIGMSEGEVQSALKYWNQSGRPIIDDILHNYYLNFGSWVVRKAIAFKPDAVLHYADWKTTEARLFQTNNFANVGLEVEATAVPDHYAAIVRTTAKSNDRTSLLWNLLKGGLYDTAYLNYWNAGNAGINFTGTYRWSPDRRLAEARVYIPLPLPGILHMELSNTWRNERWDLTKSIRTPYLDRGRRLNLRANTIQISAKHIPHYRVEIGGGFEYTNRAARGDLPELATDSRNTGKVFLETTIRMADGTYQNRLHIEGFAARKSMLGDFNYSGGTAELNNRWTISKDTRTSFDWTVKAGTSRGMRPVEDYFVLGMAYRAANLMRGHTVADHGRNGSGPTGSDFVLGNFDIDRRIVTIPMFNSFNIPYIILKGEVFLDAAKTWDRTRIFRNSKLLVDSGASLRFETPASSFNVVYGRSLRDGKGVVYGYFERRLW